jgi:DnaJ-class molecular chaperone
MVTDSLVRDGGRLLVNTSVKTPEEIAAEQKAVGEALFEDAVEKTSEKNTRPSTYNINKPM